jgi:hypothetical protein
VFSVQDLPTLLRQDGLRFFFYSLEGQEPPHVHVERAEQVAKFWLEPVALASSSGFRSAELKRVRLLVIGHRLTFLKAWHEYFDRSS